MTSTETPTERAGVIARRAFVIGVAGLPVWWVLGVASLVPLLMALPMAWDLWTRRWVSLPPHFGWWQLFLVWVLLGVGTLWASAPGAVEDAGAGRMLVFGYRLSWYLACTVLLVWLGNTSSRLLPDRLVHHVLAWVFLVAVAGGLLGLLAPDLSITTLSQRLLPGSLRGNGFVSTLLSAEAADVQKVLGDAHPRPKAPFPFTNTWGSVISLTLVFFLAAAVSIRERWRWLAGVVLVIAAIPVVLSLNRGLWLALGAGTVGLLVLLATRRHHVALGGLVAVVILGGVATASTSLEDTVNARLDNPHSNERRSQLLVATVDSVTAGSPVVGFGSTRDVEGTFTSIAGGATPDCPACGVPPLGTQGQLWLVLFSQGWIGVLFFLAFFVLALRRTWRCRTLNQTVATFTVGVFLLQLSVYDTLGLPMMVVMVAVALAWREGQGGETLRRPSNRALATVVTMGIVGAAVGAATVPEEHLVATTVTMALTPTPTYLDVGDAAQDTEDSLPLAATVDTEAALLLSEAAMRRAGAMVDTAPQVLRDAIDVVAPPLSTVLEVTVTEPTAAKSFLVAQAVAQEYLVERRRFLDGRRDDLVAQMEQELARVDPTDPAWADTRTHLRAGIDQLASHQPEAGQVIRVGVGHRVPAERGVPVTSGLGLGGLLGLLVIRLRADVRRRR